VFYNTTFVYLLYNTCKSEKDVVKSTSDVSTIKVQHFI